MAIGIALISGQQVGDMGTRGCEPTQTGLPLGGELSELTSLGLTVHFRSSQPSSAYQGTPHQTLTGPPGRIMSQRAGEEPALETGQQTLFVRGNTQAQR